MHQRESMRAFATAVLGLLVTSCNGGTTSQDDRWTNPGDEQYGQTLPDPDTDPVEITQWKENVTHIPAALLDRMVVEVTFVAENVTKRLDIQQGDFVLDEHPDGSIDLTVGTYGILDSGKEGDTTWTTFCGVNFTVPWNPEFPPALPFEYEYTTAGITSFENAAVLESNGYSEPSCSRMTYTGDNPEPDVHNFYANMPMDDPHNVQITGSMVVETAVGVGWETEMEVMGHGHLRAKDHVGTEVEASFYFQPPPDAGMGKGDVK